MTLTIDADLDTSLWRSVIESLDAGDEVLVAKDGKTVAKLVPVPTPADTSTGGYGEWRGKVWMSPDFNDPPDDFDDMDDDLD